METIMLWHKRMLHYLLLENENTVHTPRWFLDHHLCAHVFGRRENVKYINKCVEKYWDCRKEWHIRETNLYARQEALNKFTVQGGGFGTRSPYRTFFTHPKDGPRGIHNIDYQKLSEDIPEWKQEAQEERARVTEWKNSTKKVKGELGTYGFKMDQKEKGLSPPTVVMTRKEMYEYIVNNDMSKFPPNMEPPLTEQDGTPIVVFYDLETGDQLDYHNDSSIPTEYRVKELEKLEWAIKVFESPNWADVYDQSIEADRAKSSKMRKVVKIIQLKQFGEDMLPKAEQDIVNSRKIKAEKEWRLQWWENEGLEPRDWKLAEIASYELPKAESKYAHIQCAKKIIELYPEWIQYGSSDSNRHAMTPEDAWKDWLRIADMFGASMDQISKEITEEYKDWGYRYKSMVDTFVARLSSRNISQYKKSTEEWYEIFHKEMKAYRTH